jgi:hypothetical protein
VCKKKRKKIVSIKKGKSRLPGDVFLFILSIYYYYYYYSFLSFVLSFLSFFPAFYYYKENKKKRIFLGPKEGGVCVCVCSGEKEEEGHWPMAALKNFRKSECQRQCHHL